MLFGINDDPQSQPTWQNDPPIIAALGAKYVRVALNWSTIEPSQGSFPTTPGTGLDHINTYKNAYGANNLKMVFILGLTVPSWANGSTGQYGVPSNTTDFATMCAKCASLYPGNIWELFNEPDGNQFFLPGGSPATGTYTQILNTLASYYVPLAQAAYTAIKAADPTATVFGGVAAHTDNYWYNACTNNGYLPSNYDGWSSHMYTSIAQQTGQTSSWNPYTSVLGAQLATLQSARATANDHKPHWITEFGWSAAPAPYDPDTSALPNVVSMQSQSNWTLATLNGLVANGNVGMAMIYQAVDQGGPLSPFPGPYPTGVGTTDYEAYFGVTNLALTSNKTVYTSLQSFITQGGLIYPGTPGGYRFFRNAGLRYRRTL